ncbi:MAG: hypothetical protein CMN76_11770 [Spirochaetaceae bacterium]|nr:hypothetical protein [Spirochaetaceae bacterium]|tara:strand:- start:68939 stop:69265 length:327 start_codon:yes stop_codon:yes gene_type:complete
MDKLTIASLILGITGLCIGVYHLAETHPNERAFFEMMDPSSDLDRQLWQSYEAASDMQGIAMAVICGIGLILGIVGFIQEKGLPATGAIVLNAAVLIIPLATKTHMFS